MIFYSQSAHGFYDSAVHGANIPDDAVKITRQKHAELLDGQTSGRRIDADTTGYPINVSPEPTLVELKTAKVAEMKAAAGIAIVSGINNAALGEIHTYPVTRDDQFNLNGLITESLLPGSGEAYKFWCADGGGVWARRTHTKLQIQALGKTVAEHVKAQQEKYEQKLNEIAVSDEAGLALVVW